MNVACSGCGTEHPREALSRGLRCDDCGSGHIGRALANGATVHPTLPWDRDEAARSFVEEHPDGATLDEVGRAIGATRERIRQIEGAALAKLRKRAQLVGLDPSDLAHVLGARRAGRERRTPDERAAHVRKMRASGAWSRGASSSPSDPEPPPATDLSPEATRVAELLDVLEARVAWIRSRDLEAAGELVRELLADVPEETAA